MIVSRLLLLLSSKILHPSFSLPQNKNWEKKTIHNQETYDYNMGTRQTHINEI